MIIRARRRLRGLFGEGFDKGVKKRNGHNIAGMMDFCKLAPVMNDDDKQKLVHPASLYLN